MSSLFNSRKAELQRVSFFDRILLGRTCVFRQRKTNRQLQRIAELLFLSH